MKFISTAAFETSEILPTVGVDIPFNRSFQTYQNPVVTFNSFQSYLASERHYASFQLSELSKTVILRAT